MGTPCVVEEKPVKTTEELKENANLWDAVAQPKTEDQPEAPKAEEKTEV